MTVEAYAKVNLTLEVYGKRPDGYHALRSLVAPISLADTLDVELTDDGTIASDTGYDDDLCVKAARGLFDCSIVRLHGGKRPGVRIHVVKRIPVGGGLGGGSADAAATLRALNELCHLGLTPEKLAEIGADVGSDVPALVLAQHYCRPVLMEGRGERVSLFNGTIQQSVKGIRPINQTTKQSNNQTIHLVLANPGIPVSTAEVYRICVPRTVPAEVWVNDLQAPAVKLHPEIARTLGALVAVGAADVRMSGSGATCFGFASDEDAADKMSAALNVRGLRAYSVCTLGPKV